MIYTNYCVASIFNSHLPVRLTEKQRAPGPLFRSAKHFQNLPINIKQNIIRPRA